ncbi:MAG: MMPL family transporter [Treponema sp.]|nr:MMPL family transporter [Treponema sp.]
MKKKLCLPDKFFTAAWVIFHAVILAAFFITLGVYKKVTVDADFNNMMPENSQNKAAKISDRNITTSSGKSLFVLVGHEDFAKAKAMSEVVYNEFVKYPSKFREVTLYSDYSDVTEVADFVHEWRFNVLSPSTQSELETEEKAQEFAYDALSKVYSGFTLSGIDKIGEDPFLLDERNTADYLAAVADSGTAMRPKDGVLANFCDGKWYVLVRTELTDEGALLASKKSAVPLIYKICLPLETDEIHFVFYGVSFHSHKSSSSAMSEASVISAVSLTIVAIMLLFTFRSVIPIIGSIISIIISMGIAFCLTHAIFGRMHITTILFGTSLIGSSIDYSLHYFINWKGRPDLDTAAKIRRHLFSGLVLSLVSTEICYGLLVFAPFEMLKQMATFSFAGILSSFLTATGLFTLIKLPPVEKRDVPVLRKLNFSIPHKKIVSAAVTALVIIVSLGTIIAHKENFKIKNDLYKLYVPKGRLLDDTLLAYKVLNFEQDSWLILSGETEQELLELEEEIAPLIPDTYICTSRFIPSIKAQKKSLEASKNLVPLASDQLESLGFEPEASSDFERSVEQAQGKFLTVGTEVPDSLRDLLKLIWIGNVEGRYYSLILPSRVSDEAPYKAIEAKYGSEKVYFENRLHDLGLGLDHLTRIIFTMFVIAYFVIFIVMKFFYPWKTTIKILSIPLLSVLVICATFVSSGLNIEFFCLTGMILVFGLGLDYIIYSTETHGNKLELLAITLSFLTTAISFGALTFSTFIPIHTLGLAIFSGIATAFLFTIF